MIQKNNKNTTEKTYHSKKYIVLVYHVDKSIHFLPANNVPHIINPIDKTIFLEGFCFRIKTDIIKLAKGSIRLNALYLKFNKSNLIESVCVWIKRVHWRR